MPATEFDERGMRIVKASKSEFRVVEVTEIRVDDESVTYQDLPVFTTETIFSVEMRIRVTLADGRVISGTVHDELTEEIGDEQNDAAEEQG